MEIISYNPQTGMAVANNGIEMVTCGHRREGQSREEFEALAEREGCKIIECEGFEILVKATPARMTPSQQ